MVNKLWVLSTVAVFLDFLATKFSISFLHQLIFLYQLNDLIHDNAIPFGSKLY